jgi:hypothetical protein
LEELYIHGKISLRKNKGILSLHPKSGRELTPMKIGIISHLQISSSSNFGIVVDLVLHNG